jgi:GT2 family glycosyltransferase
MPYIGYTRSKKIKKLYLLAKAIISNYGLRYFFYVAKLEFKKQKFSVFTPDSAPQPSFLQKNYQSGYDEYLKKMHHCLSNEFTNNSKMTLAVTVIVISDGNLEKLTKTMNSLQQQHYVHWSALVLPITSKSSEKISKLTDYSNTKKLDFINDDKKFNEQIKNSECDLICIVKSGDLLDKFACFKAISNFTHYDSDITYSDHDEFENNQRSYPFFKPDWSPYLFRSMDFLSPFCLIKTHIFNQISLETEFIKYLQYDVLLKCIEITNKISHVALPLCSVPKKSLENKNQYNKKIVQNHLDRIKIESKIEDGIVKNSLRVHYTLKSKPKVSILIPTRDNYGILKRCIESLEKKTNYTNKEIIIIDNNSNHPKIKDYYDSLSYKIINYKGNFNFSKMNNLAVKESSGDLLLFLNDDTKVLDPNWLDELVSVCMQSDVGAVGPKLIFSDNTIQHAGMVFLNTGAGFHPGMRLEKNTDTYHNIINVMRDYSAVTGACLLVKKDVFTKIGGFDDQFDVYYGDSDLCLKIIESGYRVVYTPFTELLHEGSNSIQFWHSGASFFDVENHQLFLKKWSYLKNGDPFYNSNLDWDYSISKNPFKLT